MDENDLNKTMGSSVELRPCRLSEFTGQSSSLDNLGVYIRAARGRDDALDHILFYGPPGLGKTTLSRIISEELGSGFRSISAPSIAKPADLAQVLVGLEQKDVLFIDEIHRLPIIVEELLYSAMEDNVITIIVGAETGQGQPIEIPISNFTLIGATTRKGMLSSPLLDRFGISVRLEYYSNDELSIIIQRASNIFGDELSKEEANIIAERSRGTPRIALKILRRLRDFKDDESTKYTSSNILRWLNLLGVCDNGLDNLDRRYLSVLTNLYNGGPVGLKTLATSLSESEETLEASVEPYLIRKGIISKTAKGRKIIRDRDFRIEDD
jgi:Holliday junction DNA helicase RuvB